MFTAWSVIPSLSLGVPRAIAEGWLNIKAMQGARYKNGNCGGSPVWSVGCTCVRTKNCLSGRDLERANMWRSLRVIPQVVLHCNCYPVSYPWFNTEDEEYLWKGLTTALSFIEAEAFRCWHSLVGVSAIKSDECGDDRKKRQVFVLFSIRLDRYRPKTAKSPSLD